MTKAPDVGEAVLDRCFALFPDIRVALFSGYGEPLLNKDVFNLAKVARGRGARTVLTTNGSLVNRFSPGAFDVFDAVTISLLSTTAKDYFSLTGSKAFDDVVEGVKMVKGSAANLQTVFVITRANVPAIPEYVRFAKSLGADRVSLVPVQSEAALEDTAKIRHHRENVALRSDDENLLCALGKAFSQTDLDGVLWPLLVDYSRLEGTCKSVQHRLDVDGAGNTAACCRGAGPRPAGGNIFGEGYIWESALRRSLLVGPEKRPPKCQSCIMGYHRRRFTP